jgi:hypothetical protein
VGGTRLIPTHVLTPDLIARETIVSAFEALA